MFKNTENDTKAHRNKQQIKIRPKTKQNHENTLHFVFSFVLFCNLYFQKSEDQQISFMLMFIAFFTFYIEGHTAELVFGTPSCFQTIGLRCVCHAMIGSSVIASTMFYRSSLIR